MSGQRGVSPKNAKLVKALDARAKNLYQLRGLDRIRLYDGPGARAAKKAREADAEAWIANLRKRRDTPTPEPHDAGKPGGGR